MLELNMVGNSDTFYLTFEKGIEDNEVFDLPEECENASGCSWLSMCTVFSGI